MRQRKEEKKEEQEERQGRGEKIGLFSFLTKALDLKVSNKQARKCVCKICMCFS